MPRERLLAIGFSGIFLSILTALTYSLFTMTKRRQIAASLFAASGGRSNASDVNPVDAPLSDRVLAPAFDRLIALGRRFSPQGVADKIAHQLDLAGNPSAWTVERILGYKGLGLVGVGLLGAMFGARPGFGVALFYGLAGAAFGFFMPNILLYNAALKRQEKIQKSLADAMDLLTISVEAGLSFDAALAQVARNTEGPLAGEFFRVLQEMQIGKGRAGAMRALGERTSVPELRGFVGAMVQADVLGIPIAKVLRTQAKEMRVKRQQRAEERAQKVPVKIMFPLVLFILPALFVIVIGPAALSIMGTLT
ncbi:MAG: type II secretion system F family protein [Mycobacteriales bacterium]